MHPLNKPEVMIGLAQDIIDQDGNLKDERTRVKISELIAGLVAWTQRLKIK